MCLVFRGDGPSTVGLLKQLPIGRRKNFVEAEDGGKRREKVLGAKRIASGATATQRNEAARLTITCSRAVHPKLREVSQSDKVRKSMTTHNYSRHDKFVTLESAKKVFQSFPEKED